ncbi:MAG: hypothetical protein GF405_05550, partial [Candidatus Eisenbacteria bacterium]|nr:hypothetical protein [Candidatus Eisenbacteria bacterium]
MRAARVLVFCVVLLASAATDGVALELFEENVLPQQSAVATCATLTGEPRGSSLSVDKRDLVIGYDDGALVVFQYDPRSLNAPAHTIRLSSTEPVLDVVGVRPVPSRSSRQDAFVIALQRRKASLVSTESMQVVHETALPGIGSSGSFVTIDTDERVCLLGGPSPLELDVRPAADSWELVATALPGRLGSSAAAVAMKDRLLFLREDHVTEVSDGGLSKVPLATGGVVSSVYGAFGDFLVVASRADTLSIVILEERSDAWYVRATVPLPGETGTLVALTDTTLVAAGGRRVASGDSIGWLAVVDPSGRVLAEEEQPFPVSHLETTDGWVAAHGTDGVLSVYDSQLTPLWDHASMMRPVDVLAGDFDGEGSLDLAVVGRVRQRHSRAVVDSMRAFLERPDLFGDAALVGSDAAGRGGRYVRQVSRAVIFMSGRGELEELLGREMRLAEERLLRGEADSAAVLANPGCSLNSVLDDVLTLRQE